MKKLFFIAVAFFFTSTYIVSAQSKPTQKQIVTLGGIESGSKVSILQVLDYPVLVLADKNEKVKSFEVTILHDGNLTNTSSYNVEGARFNQNVLNELNAAKGKKGKIYIDNLIIVHENINVKEKSLIFTFEN